MTRLDDFSIDQLMLFIGGVLGSVGALLLVIQKSKCEEINCCCFKCKRNVAAIIEEERLQMTGHSGTTPRKPMLIKEGKTLDLKLESEPEPEAEPVTTE